MVSLVSICLSLSLRGIPFMMAAVLLFVVCYSLVSILIWWFACDFDSRRTALSFLTQMLRRLSLKIIFKTQYDPIDRVFSRSGERYKIDYVASRDEFGRLRLVENGKSDVYAEIQSYKESTDLSIIISRFLNGDQTALSRRSAFFGDVVGVPTSLNEALRVVEEAERDFKGLSADIRERFDNDFGVYVSLMDNPVEWSKRYRGSDAAVVDAPAVSDPVSTSGGDE